MSEDRFDRLFADLDAAYAGEQFHERVGEYGDRVAEEFAETTVESRLAGALGGQVEMWVAGERIAGEVTEAGAGWCIIADTGPIVVNLAQLQSIRLGSRTHAQGSAASVLSIASPLRRWAGERRACRVTFAGGERRIDGDLDAVARDYLQLRAPGGRFDLIPQRAIATVRALT